MELMSADVTEKIIATAHTLKGSGISVFREQSLVYRKKRQSLVALKNKLMEINPKVKISIKGDSKVEINNHLFVDKMSRGLIVKTAAELTFVKEAFGDSCYEFFDCSEGMKLASVSDGPSSSEPQRAPPVSRMKQHVAAKKQ